MAALTNDEILEAIANMTVQQAADLVKAMEEKFGVSAAAPVAHPEIHCHAVGVLGVFICRFKF